MEPHQVMPSRTRTVRPMTSFLSSIALGTSLSLALVGPAAASGGDQGQARRALEKGEIRPLDQVLAAVRAAVPGDVVALKLERESGKWRYELKVLTPFGQRREVEIDASTLSILKDGKDD